MRERCCQSLPSGCLMIRGMVQSSVWTEQSNEPSREKREGENWTAWRRRRRVVLFPACSPTWICACGGGSLPRPPVRPARPPEQQDASPGRRPAPPVSASRRQAPISPGLSTTSTPAQQADHLQQCRAPTARPAPSRSGPASCWTRRPIHRSASARTTSRVPRPACPTPRGDPRGLIERLEAAGGEHGEAAGDHSATSPVRPETSIRAR
jgi:hypothetical protein